jgi:DNA mismatch repair protein MutL
MEDLPVFTLNATAPPEPRFDFNVSEPVRSASVPDTHGALAIADPPQSLSALSDLRPLGQIHESFIIAAGRDGLWIIDQHVAHERILFEKVLRQQAQGRVERQQLLMPILLELTAAQQIEYVRIADELDRAGFDSEPFGNRTIAVKGAPAGVGPADIEKLVFEILEIAETELRKVSLDDLRRAMAASIACRAAIKINMRLDHSKMEWLLKELAATDCPMSCPHGRPIALRYSTKDILKSFHRI